MATAKKLKSGSWNCRVYSHTETVTLPDGTTKDKLVYKSFTCDTPGPKGKRECERMAAQWAAEKERHQGESTMTFGEALERYLAARKPVLSPSTMRGYLTCAKHLEPLAKIRMDLLTQERIQKLIGELSVGHSPKTVRNVHGLISAVMKAYNPGMALNTKLPQKVRPELYIPTDEDVKRLIAAVTGTELELPILLAAFGPMRRGEICALEKSDIVGNVVHVRRNMVRGKESWVTKSPKSYAGDRYIKFPDFVRAKWECVSTNRVCPMCPDTVTEHFLATLRRIGLPHFRFHDLRHYSASIQHALGVPDAYIMARGGWENDSTLKAIYRHAMSDQTERMNDIANGYFSGLYETKYETV